MAFFVCGIHYKTAPLAVREQIAQHMSSSELSFEKNTGIEEYLVVSTCNRTELYVEARDLESAQAAFCRSLETFSSTHYLYCYEGIEAIQHALRVACGIDSMVIGEAQILGQMKRAYATAKTRGTIQKQLRLIFTFIFSASKRIRHQSGIGHNPVSIASMATRLVETLFDEIKTLQTLIIGTGEMATLMTRYLEKQGVQNFFVASRTLESATMLANTLKAPSLTISEIPTYLAKVDLVVTATACPMPFIHKNMVEQAMAYRSERPLVFLDLAVPRDVESDVNDLDQVSLFNIDDLHATIENNMLKKQKAALLAEQMIEQEIETYIKQHRSLKANHVISDFRTQMKDLAEEELKRAQQKLSNGQCQYRVLHEFSERLINKLMHLPTIGLKQAASENRHELLELAQYLLGSSLGNATHEKIS